MMCEACPARDVVRIRECPGIGHPPICDDIRRGRPGRRDQILWVTTGNEPPRFEEETARLAAAMDAEFERHAAVEKVPLAVARLIIHCEAKGPPCSPCGSFATCRAGKGHPETGAVAYATCVACKTPEVEAATHPPATP